MCGVLASVLAHAQCMRLASRPQAFASVRWLAIASCSRCGNPRTTCFTAVRDERTGLKHLRQIDRLHTVSASVHIMRVSHGGILICMLSALQPNRVNVLFELVGTHGRPNTDI